MTETGALQAIRLQIMWNRLLSVVEEQAQTLIRTAFSTSVREAGDLSAGVFDLEGRMLAAASVGFFLERFPPGAMAEGDHYITNDPWLGTGHLHDFTVVSPTFRDGRPVALFASTSHVVDIGGRGFGPDARQVYEEGLRIPIMPLARRGEMNGALLEIVRANVREPVQVEGDLYSLAACNETGGRRLLAMMAEFGLETLDTLAEHVIGHSRAAMLEEIGRLEFGTYRNAMRVDGYEHEVDLVAAMTIGVSGYGINVPITYTQAYASFGVRCVVGGAIPNNAGSLAPVRVTAPEGSILNAPPPCAVATRHVIGQMLPDVMLGCLAQATEDRVPAEGTSCLWIPTLLGGHGMAEGEGARDASAFAISMFHAGGTGGRPGKDGLSATAFPSGVRNTPVEINETVAPIVIWRKEYRRDSGGPGRHRGGAGQVMEIAHAEGAPFAVSTMFDRVVNPARGREGGGNGATGRVRLASGAELRAKGRQGVPAGARLVLEMPGGGGYGDPRERAPARVAEDVRNGFVSREGALRDYGVEVGADGTAVRAD